jgi:transposase
MYSVGIDTRSRTHAVCILAEDGAVVKEFTVKGGVDDLVRRLGAIDGPFRACYEASLGYGVLYDRLAPVAAGVQVAHPAALRSIFRSKRKNDRIDAHKLARLVRLNEVPAIHVPSAQVREWRVVIEHRRRLIDKRTRAKNGLRAVLRSQGIQAPRGRVLWTRKGMAWAGELVLNSPLTRLRRDQLLLEIEHLTACIRAVEKALDAVASKDPRVALLRTIPGVGPRTAEAVVAYVDEPERFTTARHGAAYFGLVPCLDESAGTKRYGHITRQGPATVRKLLVEASWRAIALSPSMRAHFERIKGGKKDRTGVALVAVAHRLVKVMVAMLKSGEEWREVNAAPPTPTT